jgi:hypothetical protein
MEHAERTGQEVRRLLVAIIAVYSLTTEVPLQSRFHRVTSDPFRKQRRIQQFQSESRNCHTSGARDLLFLVKCDNSSPSHRSANRTSVLCASVPLW